MAFPGTVGIAPPPIDDFDEPGDDEVKKKPKKKGDDIYVTAARIIARCIDLWCEPDKVFKVMRLLDEEEASKVGELDEDDTSARIREECLRKISLESREFVTRVYYKLLQMIPSLKTIVDDPARSDELTAICNKLGSEIRTTRSSDATRLKPCIPRYCLPNPDDPTSLKPPVILSKSRAEMGLNHPILARWLCPLDRLGEFDEDPVQAQKDLASGVIPMEAEDFPAFVSSGAMPGEHYDPRADDIFTGLFRSYFLIRVARHIFLGPSFAIDPPDRRNRACNAILNDITTIEPEHIAYVCIQARSAITSKAQWSEQDGNLNYCDMYRAIIRFIKNAEDVKWQEDLLRFWNKELFGNENGRRGSVKSINGDSAPRMSTMARLQARMKARLIPPPDSEDPPFALDPALRVASPQALPPLPGPSTTTCAVPLGPSRPLILDTTSAVGTSSAATDPAMTTTRPQSGPVTPQQSRVTMDPPFCSPLSDEEVSMPLTPITNKRGKQDATAKSKGKRRADDNMAANDMAVGGGRKKTRRSRK